MHLAHAGGLDQAGDVLGAHASTRHHGEAAGRPVHQPPQAGGAEGGCGGLAGGQHAGHPEFAQQLEGRVGVGGQVERTMAGDRQRRGRRAQGAHSRRIEAAGRGEHAGDDAIGAAGAEMRDVGEHRGEFGVAVAEVAGARPHHDEQWEADRGARRGERARARGQAAFAEAGAQFEAVGAGVRGGQGPGGRLDGDLDDDPCIGGAGHEQYGGAMRAQLLHLSGPLRGRTVTYEARTVRLGSGDGNEAVLAEPAVAARHAQIEFVQEECQFHLRRDDGQVFVNGTEVEEVILQDGDQIELGSGGPRLRFRIYVPIGAVCKPVRRMLADARDVGRVSGGAAATRTLTRDLLTQATLRLKIGVPLVAVGGAFLAAWLGSWLGGRPRPELVTRAELEALQRQQEQQRKDAPPVDLVTHAELEALRAEQRQQQEALASLARANAAVRQVQKVLSRGVCLLHGVFRLRLPDGEWFAPEGEPFEYEYTGSGFRVTEAGHIVTNRHVIAPWLELAPVVRLIERGAAPEFVHLTATFPGKPPIDVPPASITRRTDDLDVAVVKLPAEPLDGVPVLQMHDGPLDSDDQRAIVVGYPTGLAAMLARADNAMVAALQQRGASMTDAIAELARTGQIAPVITEGVISNVQENVIAYSAPTTHGGSGGPVFGGNGTVVAVNFAILREFTGSNLGVPIRYARELLPAPK